MDRFDASFRFLDDYLNGKLIQAFRRSPIQHAVDESNAVRYSTRDDEAVENGVIASIRDQVFASWQIVFCPEGWHDKYMGYMQAHSIPFQVEVADGEKSFLVPGHVRPHAWKL